MTYISAKNLCITFPTYENSKRSLKNVALRSGFGLFRNVDSAGVHAIKNITFEIKTGQRVGLIGHNGSGKTTLLRTLSGIYHPTHGSLTVDGNVSSLLDLSGGFNHDATGYENIFLRSILFGKSKEETNQRVEEIIEFSELGQYIGLPVRTYSTGMIMRLAFAIATSIQPQILLMDEWLSVGDSDFHEKATTRLNELIDTAGILIIATHDKNIIDSVCTRVLRLESGKIVSDEDVINNQN
jgi:lipopolysaccharide transport system ATP-binding protein